MSSTDADLRRHVHAERERLAGLLAGLSPEGWGSPSLCSGWRVREVVAHITAPFRTSLPRVVAGLVAARFSFDRYSDRAARGDTARLSDADLLACLRANITHPWRPPGGGTGGALSHDTIHGLDITEPLGLPAPPVERIALVLAGTNPRNLSYFGVDLTGVQLRGADADVRVGTGEPVELPAKDILLTITGRRPLPSVTT
ncbi:maleylpyruvate isomerase family mycothiol-dependent enzyme [Nonomuraea sp. LP-02]|uniref:maleylpyruvate isomerase family mycothiol-dependent enzyme n=1 Tax=Nonomuraea sp. LP-02 TaxID=3097960 RepID=UPI002E30F9D4|nr:maleylpyruvate isomerase family mycothiol-dependent enzyme [Nonomuraea sp. LP-02]MED7925150.1 maleylpyruvate isomerase family mycothiol-dependent enzyme [Nonomuraea sp. LP-02]